MGDAADVAQPGEEALHADALAAHAANRFHEEPFYIDGVRACRNCFAPLSKKRLKAAPEAVRCVDCQNIYEQQQRRSR